MIFTLMYLEIEQNAHSSWPLRFPHRTRRQRVIQQHPCNTLDSNGLFNAPLLRSLRPNINTNGWRLQFGNQMAAFSIMGPPYPTLSCSYPHPLVILCQIRYTYTDYTSNYRHFSNKLEHRFNSLLSNTFLYSTIAGCEQSFEMCPQNQLFIHHHQLSNCNSSAVLP